MNSDELVHDCSHRCIRGDDCCEVTLGIEEQSLSRCSVAPPHQPILGKNASQMRPQIIIVDI